MSDARSDPRRPEKVKRFKSLYALQFTDDQTQEYMNVLGMVLSMCGLMMKVTHCIYFLHNLQWEADLSTYCVNSLFMLGKTTDSMLVKPDHKLIIGLCYKA